MASDEWGAEGLAPLSSKRLGRQRHMSCLIKIQVLLGTLQVRRMFGADLGFRGFVAL